MCLIDGESASSSHLVDTDDDNDDFVEFRDQSRSTMAVDARQPSVAKQPVVPSSSAANHSLLVARNGRTAYPVMFVCVSCMLSVHAVLMVCSQSLSLIDW